MADTLPTALAITAIGMTLLFLTLGLFYGLLTLLTGAIRDRADIRRVAEAAPAATAAMVGDDSASGQLAGARQRAAAAAVALARAEAEAGASDSLDRGQVAATGTWWALHHGRRLAAPHSPWRGR